jgi:tetratricopeptide (TPR) repeat protein
MAERHEAEEPLGTVEPVAAQAMSDGGAVAAALALALKGGKADERLDEFLAEQTRFLRLQSEHLHEQRALQVRYLEHQEKHLKLRYFGDRLRIALQLLGVVAGLAVVAFLAAMAWNAHRDRGVSIAAFSVPPDLAQRGLTGQVVASQLLDRLAGLQKQTVSGRPGSTYANDWGGDIKVEIPETGVSIGELNRYLREWLGRETRITGEVVRTPAGLAVTARAGARPGATFRGADADLDALVQESAEAIYSDTQPYRYAVYLASQGKADQAIAAYARLAQTGDRQDRAWAYTGWASLLLERGDPRGVLAKASEALRLDPRIQPAADALALSYGGLGRPEDETPVALDQLKRLESGQFEGITPEAAQLKRDFVRGALSAQRGDLLDAVARLDRLPETIDFEGAGGLYSLRESSASFLFLMHDVSGARRRLAGAARGRLLNNPALEAVALEDWPRALSLLDQAPAAARSIAGYWSDRALYLARLGRLTEAQAAIAETGPDCTECLAVRGMIRALAGDRQGSDRWFAQAAARAGTFPIYHTAWGQSLLEQGDLDGAIDKLKEAHRRGPHFADPLELWGEALMRKADYSGAAAKFAEADKYAPRWGRNHLRWGEALMLQGRYREARAQYEAANGMDLSRADRAALDVLLDRTAKGALHG